jgi:iron complex outermembrane receptor protein
MKTTRLLLSAVLAASLPAASFAQNLIGPASGAPDTILGAQRLPDRSLDESRVPARVSVITAEDLRRSGARSVQEAVASAEGVVSYDQNGNSFQSTLDMRGFNATPVPSIAVVVDGVRVNESDFGQINYHLIPIENVARIEIHRGPSTRFGKNAMAGVVHITTKRGSSAPYAGETGLAFGSFDRRTSWANAGGRLGSFDYFVSGNKEIDHGYRDHSDGDVGSVFVKLGYNKEERSDITVSYTRADDRLEQPGSLTGAEIGADPQQTISEVDMVSKLDFFQYDQRQSLGSGMNLALNGHLRKRREETPRNVGRTSVAHSLSVMETQGLAAQLGRDYDLFGLRNVTEIGGETATAQTDAASNGAFGTFPFQSGTLHKDRSFGLFALQRTDLIADALILTGGLRYDESQSVLEDRVTPTNDGRQAFHRTSPHAGLNLNIGENCRFYASYSEAFRTPTTNEISALGPFGQNTLRPVRTKNYEIGAHAQLTPGLSLEGSLYRNDAADEIYPVFDPTAGFGKNINIDKVRRVGAEWRLKARGEKVGGFIGHTYSFATIQSPITLDKAPWPATQNVSPGAELPAVPRHRIRAGIDVRPVKGWTVSTQGQCTGSQRIFGDESNTEAKLPGYCTMNMGTSLEKGAFSVYFNGYNVLNKKHATRAILATNPATFAADRFHNPSSGATVMGGVRFRFSADGLEPTARTQPSSEWARSVAELVNRPG